MSNQYLISFCNFTHDRPSGLLWVQTDPFEAAWIIPESAPFISSCTGLVQHGEKIYFTGHYQSHGFIAALNAQDYALTQFLETDELVDPHSLTWLNNQLYVANTGRDEISKINILNDRLLVSSAFKTGTNRTDTFHINGLCTHNDHLLYCAFGQRPSTGWKDADGGYINNIATGHHIADKLAHPHSLFSHSAGAIFWCESHKGLVSRGTDGKSVSLPGYTRGLYMLDNNSGWVGISKRRSISKSTGKALAKGDAPASDSCGIAKINFITGKHDSFIDLTDFGDEIYDIINLTSRPRSSIISTWRKREQSYSRSIEDKAHESLKWGSCLHEQLMATREALTHHIETLAERTAWAQSLDKELQATKHTYDTLAKEYDERTTWAQSLELELNHARQILQTQIKLVEERTAWAQSLEKELQATTHNYTTLTKEYEERTTWAQSLDKELQTTTDNYAKLAKEHAAAKTQMENVKSDATLTATKAIKLESELSSIKNACSRLSEVLHVSHPQNEAALIHDALIRLTQFQRELALREEDANQAHASLAEYTIRTKIAESDAKRATTMAKEAQIHVNNLMDQCRQLQQSVHLLNTNQQSMEASNTALSNNLQQVFTELKNMQLQLARYEGVFLCRLGARLFR